MYLMKKSCRFIQNFLNCHVSLMVVLSLTILLQGQYNKVLSESSGLTATLILRLSHIFDSA